MKIKIAFLFSAVVLWTVLSYSLLFFLGQLRVDPVVFVPNQSHPEFLAHGMPRLSFVGAVTWLGVLAIYAGGTIFLVARTSALQRSWHLIVGFLVLFLLSASYVAIVHPSLLFTVLSPDLRPAYSRFIEAHVPFLDQIYFHWGLLRLKCFVLIGQVLINFGVTFVLLYIAQSPARRAAQEWS